MVHVLTRLIRLVVPAIVALATILPCVAVAQIQPSAEQMRMINQLPPAQRQQALDAIEALQNQDAARRTTTPVTEEDGDGAELPFPLAAEQQEKEPEPRATSNGRLVVSLTPREILSSEEVRKIQTDPLMQRLVGTHHFVLDDDGALALAGLRSIPLLGLTEPDIVERLSAEPMLEFFDIRVRVLEIEMTGLEALKPFGYDIFEPDELSVAGFDPASTGPVPSDYVLGPGDSIRVQLFGNVNDIFEFDVTRDGILNLPQLGPVNVLGMPFSETSKTVWTRC
jgi:hypothetical protein